jgi:hypothetical protein
MSWKKIGKLYELERDLRMKLVDGDISEPEFSAVRTRNARRIMSRIELWLGEKMNSVTLSQRDSYGIWIRE